MNRFFKKKPPSDNPFVAGSAGRQEWNDRYHNLSAAAQQWRFACLLALGMLLLFAILLAKLALASKVQPFIVETHEGRPYAMQTMSSLSVDDSRLINFVLNEFIVNAKTVIDSTESEQALLRKVYAFSEGDTVHFLAQFYQKNNPFLRAEQGNVAVHIVHAMPTGKQTWQLTWEETTSDTISGAVLGKSRWIGYVEYALGEVNPDHIQDNPFGLYITHVSWSETQADLPT